MHIGLHRFRGFIFCMAEISGRKKSRVIINLGKASSPQFRPGEKRRKIRLKNGSSLPGAIQEVLGRGHDPDLCLETANRGQFLHELENRRRDHQTRLRRSRSLRKRERVRVPVVNYLFLIMKNYAF